MFMWTVGYTVGDIMYVAQTTADQRSASWFSKVLECLAVTLENETAWLTPLPQVLWLLALLCVLTYAGYQIYLSYLSYTNPDWYHSSNAASSPSPQTCDEDLWRAGQQVCSLNESWTSPRFWCVPCREPTTAVCMGTFLSLHFRLQCDQH